MHYINSTIQTRGSFQLVEDWELNQFLRTLSFHMLSVTYAIYQAVHLDDWITSAKKVKCPSESLSCFAVTRYLSGDLVVESGICAKGLITQLHKSVDWPCGLQIRWACRALLAGFAMVFFGLDGGHLILRSTVHLPRRKGTGGIALSQEKPNHSEVAFVRMPSAPSVTTLKLSSEVIFEDLPGGVLRWVPLSVHCPALPAGG